MVVRPWSKAPGHLTWIAKVLWCVHAVTDRGKVRLGHPIGLLFTPLLLVALSVMFLKFAVEEIREALRDQFVFWSEQKPLENFEEFISTYGEDYE